MTLKEIEKIIDEADFYWFKDGDKKRTCALSSQEFKNIEKPLIEQNIKNGKAYIFFKFNDNGEVEKSWLVDHICKEKKIVKKKLDEMSEEEIEQVEARICKPLCYKCPFLYKSQQGNRCLREYGVWKKGIEDNKDKEFDVEVEE